MNKKTSIALASVCLLLTAPVLVWAAAQKPKFDTRDGTTPDGRFGTRCTPWGPYPFREMCQVSFYRLLANPEQYDGRLVGLQGLLINALDQPMLFVNRQSYDTGNPGEGILVDGEIPPEFKEFMGTGIFPAIVIGVFDAKYLGNGVPVLGALRKIELINTGAHFGPHGFELAPLPSSPQTPAGTVPLPPQP